MPRILLYTVALASLLDGQGTPGEDATITPSYHRTTR